MQTAVYLHLNQSKVTFAGSNNHIKMLSLPILLGLNTIIVKKYSDWSFCDSLSALPALVYSCCTAVCSKSQASTCDFSHILGFQVLSSNCDVEESKNITRQCNSE